VVPVTFVDSEDKNTEDISRLMTDPGRARVAAVVAKLVDHDGAELLEYSKRLIRILSERSEQFESSLASFRAIAEHTKDSRLFNQIEEAEKKFERLRRAEESARKQADQERAAKEAAEARASHAEEVAQRATLDLHEERKRNVFLASMANLDTETIVNLHHQITIYAVNIQHQIQNFLARTSAEKSTTVAQALETMESISLLNLKILGIAKFATKANFRLESEAIQGDLGEYIRQYVEEVAQLFLQEPVTLLVEHDGKGFVQSFKPIDISVVIDNLVANAKKARATEVRFVITHPARHTIHVLVHDNGRGFDKRITDLDRVFEKGFTTTDGSGLGLFHVKQVLGEMKGTIEARKTNSQGAEFLIRIAK
jgi:signal transduction histidine kinase